MANPQLEDGHTEIANEILEALWKVNLSSYEWRVLLYLLRKTYGWHKKTDWIPLSQFSKDTGIDRRHVHRALKMLERRELIVAYRGDKRLVSYGFQKNYERWRLSPIKATVPIQATKLSPIQAPSKENKKKKTLRDSTNPAVSEFIDFFCRAYQEKFNQKYPVNGGKDGSLTKEMLNQFSLEHLKGLITRFFQMKDSLIESNGHTIGIFKIRLAGLNEAEKRAKSTW